MTRRIRVKRTTTIVTASDRKQIEKLVNCISANTILLDSILVENKRDMKELEGLMTSSDLKEFKAKQGMAQYITPASRESSVIDVFEFRGKVSTEDFMECITVGKAKAKKVLSERELEAISTKAKATAKKAVLKVTPK